LVAPLTGIAQGAVDVFTERFIGTSGKGQTADSVMVQMRLAVAAVEVEAARTLHRRTVDEMLGKAERSETFSSVDRARFKRDKTYVAKLCVQAVNRLFDGSGGGSIYESESLQRFHRDVHAASHQQGINWDAAAEDYGRQALGLAPAPGRYD
jgi:3-hydroxy-9,10-secoandrosta-1,3,5(10)-triene-9,17-dione monooxygenase